MVPRITWFSIHAGPSRRPVAGDKYATVTKSYGLRHTTWLLTPRTNRRRRKSMRSASEHGKKRTLQQTIEHSLSSPSRTAWTRKRRNEASCARRRNTRTPRQQRVFSHRNGGGHFFTQRRSPNRLRDGGRLFRRREKKETRRQTSKLNSRISHTIKPRP